MSYKLEIDVEHQEIKYIRSNFTYIFYMTGLGYDLTEVNLKAIQSFINNPDVKQVKLHRKEVNTIQMSYKGLIIKEEDGYIYAVTTEGTTVTLKDLPGSIYNWSSTQWDDAYNQALACLYK